MLELTSVQIQSILRFFTLFFQETTTAEFNQASKNSIIIKAIALL